MTRSLAEAIAVRVNRESAFNTPTTSDWAQAQPNTGGVEGWINAYKTEERDPLSQYGTMEAGEVVGFDATPKLVCDLTKDWLDLIVEPTFRSVGKHNGGTGVALFRPTAVTSTGYTVPASGALAAGILINVKGCLTAANNGTKVVGASSTGTEIKTSGLTAETLAATLGATLEVVGVQGTTGDIGIDTDGNLTSTTLDFTTLGLNVYQDIKIGGPTATAATRFATSDYNGYAQITAITATKISLRYRSWTVGAADAGTGKTIWILFSRWYRNVAFDHADYLEPTLHGELEERSVGTGGAATYVYAGGMALKTLELNAPLESKIEATTTFCAKDVADPVLVASRKAGPSTARAPMAATLFHTSRPMMQRVRVTRISDSVALAAEVNSWKFTMEHEVKPREIQGGLGAEDMIYGKIKPSVSMEIYYTTSEVAAAMRSNPPVMFEAAVRNDQAGWILRIPYARIRGGTRNYAANEAIMCSLEVPGFRETNTNIVASMSVFGYWPE